MIGKRDGNSTKFCRSWSRPVLDFYFFLSWSGPMTGTEPLSPGRIGFEPWIPVLNTMGESVILKYFLLKFILRSYHLTITRVNIGQFIVFRDIPSHGRL